MSKTYLARWVLCLGLVLGTASVSNASALGLDFSAETVCPQCGFQMLGWQFSVNSTITLDGLGVFDLGADGLVEDHEVGVWDSANALLTSTIVTSASALTASATVAGDWRFESIAPLILAPGVYVIGAYYPTFAPTDAAASYATIMTIPEITYLQSMGGVAGFFREPGIWGAAEPGLFGPGLRVADAAAVPEPASLLLLGTGVAGLIATRYRRGRRS